MSKDDSSSNGVLSLGTILAAVLSWALNHSVGWAILHFVFGWLYIVYAVITRTKEIVPALKNMFM